MAQVTDIAAETLAKPADQKSVARRSQLLVPGQGRQANPSDGAPVLPQRGTDHPHSENGIAPPERVFAVRDFLQKSIKGLKSRILKNRENWNSGAWGAGGGRTALQGGGE